MSSLSFPNKGIINMVKQYSQLHMEMCENEITHSQKKSNFNHSTVCQ